jgi:type I restriction enzyme R subunit
MPDTKNTTLETTNFLFLQDQWPDLASLARFAESYVYTDIASCLVKLRIFAEKMVDILYYELGLQRPEDAVNFIELLQGNTFRQAVPPQVINFLHLIRKEGNKGAHENVTSLRPEETLRLLANVHQVSIWFYGTVTKTSHQITAFQPPPNPISASALIAEKAALEAKIKALEEEQTKERSAHPKAPAPVPATLEWATEQAVTIGLTEAQTRVQLIDSLLDDAKWSLLDNPSQYDATSGKSQCIREYPVLHQPTKTGKGAIDYVLMGKDGQPIAVIEAKKTAESAEKGKTQAELYAHGIEKMTGRRPFIFYTNGHDIFFWDDTAYPPRKVGGFFDAEKLEYMLFQRSNKKSLAGLELNTSIAGRGYQLEAIRRVYEDFEACRRKALIVMATGTGKTRVATSIIDGLMRANWGKRVLFLTDRVELQRQAIDAFKEFLPDEKLSVVSADTKHERDARIYLATYSTMMNAYSTYNVAFFDIVIADESHRSIYQYYRELFQYFDAYQIGLTATPIEYVSRNTFKFFEREDSDPTFYFSLNAAINHQPPYLVNYKVNNETTGFLLGGIKYDELTEAQRAQLEEQDENPQTFNYERESIDKQVMNKETNRKILQNLMNKGLRNSDGTRPGKTIVFARGHRHALLMEELFNELYPEHHGKICQVIDHFNPRRDDLIDGFKGRKKEFQGLDIAISVDMLDTGIDVPEVVNLVFAKPVYSKVKFWQMIGRGTRLCQDLFGPGKDKTHFLIFDPWRNFEFFGENPDGFVQEAENKSVPERLFSVRLNLLHQLSIAASQTDSPQDHQPAFDPAFQQTILSQIQSDIDALPQQSVNVRDKWQELERIRSDAFWAKRDTDFYQFLSEHVQPLMRWRNIEGDKDAINFDIKITRLILALVQGKHEVFDNLQDKVIDDVERLRTNLNPVKQELELIQAVQKAAWWQGLTVEKLDDMRQRLRGLMKYRSVNKFKAKSIDIEDYSVAGTQTDTDPQEAMAAYRERVVEVVLDLVSNNLTLQKIRRGLPVTETDIVSLQSLILNRVPGLKPEDLTALFPGKAEKLDALIRSLVGMDELTVHLAFDAFRQSHTTLKANQVQFLTLVEQEIIRSGGLEIAQLYEQPFTSIHTLGLDGLFQEAEADELIKIIKQLVG